MKPENIATEDAIATFALTEKYIKTLKWSKDSDDYIKTLVIGNIRGFFMWLFENDYIVPIGWKLEINVKEDDEGAQT